MLSRNKQEQRKSSFKKAVSADESRRKREEACNEIRKNKREESLMKRRVVAPDESQTTIEPVDISNVTPELLTKLSQATLSNDPTIQLEATTQLRRILSIEKHPPIADVIKTGVVPRLVQFLTFEITPKLQYEAAWALTNIASGSSEQTMVVINSGAVPLFVKMMNASDEEMREQAVWGLGNIAGDSPQARDYVLGCGIMTPLLSILNSSTSKITLIRNGAWCFSNLCRGKPQPKLADVQDGLPVMARLLQTTDTELLTDVLWAFSYISDGPDQNIQAVLNTGAAPRLVELLGSNSFSIQTPALRAVGNIITGTDTQTQVMLDLGVLPYLYKLLQSQRKAIRKEAAWTVSNITAGNASQTQLVIANSIFPLLANLLSNGEYDVKKEALYAVTNATTWKNPKQVRHLVDAGMIKPLVELLSAPDPKMILVALDGLENILLVGQQLASKGTAPSNPYTVIVEEFEGIDKLEELQSHENSEVYQKAIKILEAHFNASEEENMMVPNNAVPLVQQQPNNQLAFSFGSNVSMPSGGFVF